MPENIGIDSSVQPYNCSMCEFDHAEPAHNSVHGLRGVACNKGVVMLNFDLSSFLAALVALPEVFEKNPHGAMMVSGLVALLMVCWTIISVAKRQ
jgi:hypothetical protein